MSKQKNRLLLGVACAVIAAMAILVPLTVENTYATFWALVPPVVAIGLALITKEVYSSLFVGIVVGGAFACGGSIPAAVDNVVGVGLVNAVSGSAGIFVFLVILGVVVSLLNRAGGSAAFGRWARTHIKTRVGAQLATFVLGVLIFIDDYFNCLTVGSVMLPVTDGHRISRAKLAYLIDATAAPICMIAPISSWAAAVSKFTEGTGLSGIGLFVRAIPYNFYSLLTFVFVLGLILMQVDYGPMARHEHNAVEHGDLFSGQERVNSEEVVSNPRSRVIDLVLPIVILVVISVVGLLYVGGYFGVDAWGGTEYAGDFVGAFGNTDAFVGLPWGGILALIFLIAYLVCRRLLTFKEAMDCVPQGFIAMVLMHSDFAQGLSNFLPAVIFVVACLLAFATGTSWGTFGILIPIVSNMFGVEDPLLYIGMSACLAGAVCGDHCSPISDTTIMSSAGAQCAHVVHVSTQLPYAVSVAAVSFVCFLLAGFLQNAVICLAVGVVLILGFLAWMKRRPARA